MKECIGKKCCKKVRDQIKKEEWQTHQGINLKQLVGVDLELSDPHHSGSRRQIHSVFERIPQYLVPSSFLLNTTSLGIFPNLKR